VLRAGVGLSTERDSTRAAVEAAGAALRAAGLEQARVALVFATTPHGPGWERALRAVVKATGTREIAGCSTAGVLVGDDEVDRGPAIAVLVLGGDLTARRFMVSLTRGRCEDAADALATAVGDVAVPGGLVLLFADTYRFAAEPFFARLQSLLPGVRVVGGGASEDGSVGEVVVFAGDTAAGSSVSGLVLGPDVAATVGVAQALHRVGAIHRVTAADGNLVLALDGRPALDVFRTVVPEPLLTDPRRALAVVLAGVSAGNDEFVARHLVGFDGERRGLALAAPVPTGHSLFFGVREPNGAREGLDRMLCQQTATWRGRHAAAALYASCIGRGRRFFGVPGLETAYLRQHLGALPLIGFTSGAEFAPGGGATHLHQYTGVLAVLGDAR
jgi:small ligand-binding sensory domain FIST